MLELVDAIMHSLVTHYGDDATSLGMSADDFKLLDKLTVIPAKGPDNPSLGIHSKCRKWYHQAQAYCTDGDKRTLVTRRVLEV